MKLRINQCKYCGKVVISLFKKVNHDICKLCFTDKVSLMGMIARNIDCDLSNLEKYDKELLDAHNYVWETNLEKL